MSQLPTEQVLDTVRMLDTLKCVARYDFEADDGQVYYLSDYEFGKGKHLHVCLLNVPDSEFRIAPLRYLTVQPRSSWYVNDTKIDTESEIGPQLAGTMREWLNSNPWKEFTSFDSTTGFRLFFGVDKIKHYACCGCAIGSHKGNPEELEDHKDNSAGDSASALSTQESHPFKSEGGEAGFTASADRTGGNLQCDDPTVKNASIPQPPESSFHNERPFDIAKTSSNKANKEPEQRISQQQDLRSPFAEPNFQQGPGGANAESTKVNGASGYSPATMAYQAKQDRQRICTVIDTSLKERGFFASPDTVDAAYDAGFRTCTDEEGFGTWCRLWNIPRNLPEGSSSTKEAHQTAVPDAPHGSVPQGMMLINMDLVPLEHRDFVAQWCKPVPPATTPNGAAPITSQTSNDGPPSTAINDQSKTAQKRSFQNAFDLDTMSNKKRVRSYEEMSLYQSCYSQSAHPVQPYGSNAAPEDEIPYASNEHSHAENRAQKNPSSPSNKSGSSSREASGNGLAKSSDADNTSKSKAVQGVKRKNEDDHDGFRNFIAPKSEPFTTSKEQSRSNEKRVLRTPSSPATTSSSSSRTSSPIKPEYAGSPSEYQEPRRVKRKNSKEHPKVFHGQVIDLISEDEDEEANIKASADVLRTRKIAKPSRRLDEA